MAYWLDEGFHSWPEIVRAGTAAAGLYARCGAYIADHTLDGLVPAEVAAMYGTREWAQKLIDVGLWTIEGDGYRDLRYFGIDGRPLNPTAETVRKRRDDAAERQRRLRSKTPVTRDKTSDSRGTHTGSNAVSHSTPALPPSLREGQGAQAREAPPTNPENPDWRALPAYGQTDPQPDTPARAAARQAATKARRPPPTTPGAALDALRTITDPPPNAA